MQRDLSRLTEELRKETCPRRVLEKAEQRISAQRISTSPWRFAAGLAGVVAVLVCGLFVWQWNVERHIRQQAKLVESASDRARIANEAEDALGLVGSVLLDAGVHSEKIISDRAVSPLRDSLEITKNKIIKGKEL